MTWWNAAWLYKVRLRVDHTKVDAALTDFPAYIYLYDGRPLDVGTLDITKFNADFSDVRFLDDATETTVYDAELEDYTAATNAHIHLRIPAVADADFTYVYMYFGNAAAASLWNPSGVWDSNFVMVQHMVDDPDTSHIADSTSNNNDGTKTAANEPLETASGQIDSAQDFDGLNDFIDCGNAATLTMGTSQFTLSTWVKTPSFLLSKGLITTWNGVADNSYRLSCESVGLGGALHKVSWVIYLSPPLTWYVVTSTTSIDDGDYHKITCIRNATHIALFIDGLPEGVPVVFDAAADVSGSEHLFMGQWWVGGSFLDMDMDETRISKGIARSAAWDKAEYWSGLDGLLTYGALEPQPVTTAEEAVGALRRRRDDRFLTLFAEWYTLRSRRLHGQPN